jgi:AcrR family transcriptional regulator
MDRNEEPEEPAVAPEAGPRWRRRKDERPQELIRAALELFGEKGFAHTTLRDVAKRAGVSKGTVYLYFKNKEDLVVAAVRESVVPILDFGDQLELDNAELPAPDLLALLLRRWVAEFDQPLVAGVPMLVMTEARQIPRLGEAYVDLVVQRARRLFSRVIKRGIREGAFREVDVERTVHLLMAPVAYTQIHRHALGQYDPGDFDAEAFVDNFVEFALGGLRA